MNMRGKNVHGLKYMRAQVYKSYLYTFCVWNQVGNHEPVCRQWGRGVAEQDKGVSSFSPGGPHQHER